MKNKVLLVGMQFGDYDLQIKRTMECEGYVVTLISDASKRVLQMCKLLSHKRKLQLIQKYQNIVLRRLRNQKFEQVVVIVGRHLSCETLERLHTMNPGAKFKLYLWDDIKRIENFERVRSYYDVIFSFDSEDVKKDERLVFLPLFYTRQFQFRSEGRTGYLDICSAMTDYSDRLDIVRRIAKNNPQIKLDVCMADGYKLFVQRNLRVREKLWDKDNGIYYRLHGIKKKKWLKKIRENNCILDIPYSGQNGLTIRTIEALGCGKKLVTTNEKVKDYDFYHPNNIYVMGQDCIIDSEFMKSEYVELPQDIYQKYALYTWVGEILEK